MCALVKEKADSLEENPTAYRSSKKTILRHVSIDDTYINENVCSLNCHTCAFLLSTKPDFTKTIKLNMNNSIRRLEVTPQDIIDGSKPFPFLGNRKLLIQIQRKDAVLFKLHKIFNLVTGLIVGIPNATTLKPTWD